MKAPEHPEYPAEADYLRRVLGVIDQQIGKLQQLGWAGGGNPRATVLLRSKFIEQSNDLELVRSNPYFGRLDRADEGVATDGYYIGQAGLRDPKTKDRLIVDWRAEIARTFYRPDARTRLRRRFTIRNRKLLEIHDDHVAIPVRDSPRDNQGPAVKIIADPALRQILEGSRGQHLENIIATIQAEQDKIIRAPDRTMIVQGGAGTGKTIVALHRLAYLLYRHRTEAGSRRDLRVAVFGPNRLFLRFVSSVLPSLGERGIFQTTFEDWFSSWCGKDAVSLRPFDEELERLLDPLLAHETRADDYRRARLKGSLKMGAVLRRFVEQRRDEVVGNLRSHPLGILISRGWRRPIQLDLPSEFLVDVARNLRSRPLNRAREAAREKCWQRVRRQLKQIVGRQDPELPTLSNEARRRFDVAFEERWHHHQFGKAYRSLLSDRSLLDSLAAGLSASARARLRAPNHFSLEDLAPLAYLRLLLDGPARQRNDDGQETGALERFDHIVVDEAQDFAPLQLVVLRAHTDGLTLIGDIAQGIHSYRGLRSWDEAREALNGTPVRVEVLNRGYHSTRQITDCANHLLTGINRAAGVRPFPRDGHPPRLEGVRDDRELEMKVGAYVREALGHDARSVAIIAKTASHAKATHLALHDRLPDEATLVTTRHDTWTSAITVLPAYLAKGMEFDAVIVVDADAFHYRKESEYDAKLLYIAMTRALHRLFVFWTGKPSPLLASRPHMQDRPDYTL